MSALCSRRSSPLSKRSGNDEKLWACHLLVLPVGLSSLKSLLPKPPQRRLGRAEIPAEGEELSRRKDTSRILRRPRKRGVVVAENALLGLTRMAQPKVVSSRQRAPLLRLRPPEQIVWPRPLAAVVAAAVVVVDPAEVPHQLPAPLASS